jgi:hypothetical protein
VKFHGKMFDILVTLATHKGMVSPYGGHTTCCHSLSTISVAKNATQMRRVTGLTKLLFFFAYVYVLGYLTICLRLDYGTRQVI